jgi:hypothetical protein
MVSCDQSSSVLHQLRVDHRSNQFLNPELVLFGLAQILRVKLNVAFEHALHSMCIWEAWVY